MGYHTPVQGRLRQMHLANAAQVQAIAPEPVAPEPVAPEPLSIDDLLDAVASEPAQPVENPVAATVADDDDSGSDLLLPLSGQVFPDWTAKDSKAQILIAAQARGLTADESMTKAQIIALLEAFEQSDDAK